MKQTLEIDVPYGDKLIEDSKRRVEKGWKRRNKGNTLWNWIIVSDSIRKKQDSRYYYAEPWPLFPNEEIIKVGDIIKAGEEYKIWLERECCFSKRKAVVDFPVREDDTPTIRKQPEEPAEPEMPEMSEGWEKIQVGEVIPKEYQYWYVEDKEFIEGKSYIGKLQHVLDIERIRKKEPKVFWGKLITDSDILYYETPDGVRVSWDGVNKRAVNCGWILKGFCEEKGGKVVDIRFPWHPETGKTLSYVKFRRNKVIDD